MDHLLFVVHGIGSVGDLKFRSFVDCGWFNLITLHFLINALQIHVSLYNIILPSTVYIILVHNIQGLFILCTM